MLPKEWKEKPVGELCQSIVPGRNKPKFFKGTIPWVTTPEIVGRYIPSAYQIHYVDNLAIKESGAKIVPKGAVVIAAVGDLGLTAIATQDIVLNQQLHAFICPSYIVNEFLAYWLETSRGYMDSVASKTTIPYMNKANCESIPVRYPPVPEQKRIVSVLETWDKAIELLTKEIEIKKKIKKGLMQELLTGKRRLKGFDGKWRRVSLSQIAIINPSIRTLPEHFIYIDLESVKDGVLVKENTIRRDSAPSRAQRLLEKGDIVFQMVRPYQKNNLLLEKEGVFVSSTGYAQIRALEQNKFLYYMLHTEQFVGMVLTRCTGSNYPAINSSDLAAIRLLVPPSSEQTAIAQILTATDDELKSLQSKLSLLQTQKKYLLNNLVTGKIRTPENLTIN